LTASRAALAATAIPMLSANPALLSLENDVLDPIVADRCRVGCVGAGAGGGADIAADACESSFWAISVSAIGKESLTGSKTGYPNPSCGSADCELGFEGECVDPPVS